MEPPAFDLGRFVRAQEPVFRTAFAELKAGRKTSHWMWFIFPQLRGLGRSQASVFFGISGVEEARAYLAHEVLGPRLSACTGAVLELHDRSLHEIFGSPDDMKFCSCMALFAEAAGPDDSIFDQALNEVCSAARSGGP